MRLALLLVVMGCGESSPPPEKPVQPMSTSRQITPRDKLIEELRAAAGL